MTAQPRLLAPTQPNPEDIAYTPDAVAEVYVQALLRHYLVLGQTVWEPHAGGGAFVRALRNAGLTCHGSDFYAVGWPQHNFLSELPFGKVDWIVGNPPFSEARQHVQRALDVAGAGVAFILPAQLPYLVGWADLWEKATPDMFPACGRVPFLGDGTVKERDGKQAGTRDVAMYVWRQRDGVWSTAPCVLRPLRTPRSRA